MRFSSSTPATGSDGAAIYPRRWWALAVLCLSLIIIGLDNTILNVALPTMQRELNATGSELQWIVDSYVLVFAGLLLTAGALGDRFGRKLALYIGFAIFAVGSGIAAFADTPGQLIALRAVMGVGGAFIMPSTLSILTNIFPSSERPKAIAIWAASAGLAIPLGPVLGGWLLEHFSWGSVFFINLPIIAVAAVLGAVLVPESRDPHVTPLDPAGALLSIAGLAALLYAIIEAPVKGWGSGEILAWFVAAAVLLVGFVVWERRVAHPMLDVHLFRNPRFTAASLAVTLVFFSMFGMLFFLTQYLQFVLGYDALASGLRVTPVAVGIMFGAGSSTRIVERIGTKIVVTYGLAIAALGLAILSTISDTSGYGTVLTALMIMGFGMGSAMAPATESIMGAVPQAKAGVGSAVNDTTRQVGGALGVAILGSLLSTAYGNSMESTTAALPPEAAHAAGDSVGAALAIAERVGGPQGVALTQAAHSAFIDAMSTTVLVGAGVALLGALVALIFLPARAVERETTDGDAELATTRRIEATG
jgi:EmrB/QacA subfamily drug resistance transporter